jgi:pyrroloquinoline quinone biosynthesis protein B
VASRGVELVIVGVAQDGGVPQAGCVCQRCASAIEDTSKILYPTSCVIGGSDGSVHLLEATRSLSQQLGMAADALGMGVTVTPDSVSLTHAHLGHIDGLGQFGKEAMGLDGVALFASKSVIRLLDERLLSTPFQVNEAVEGAPFSPTEGCGFELEFVRVPHRDELSDTHAIIIRGPTSTLLFLPDHDDWGQTLEMAGEPGIREWFWSMGVDYALIDGTFWDSDELGGRDMSQVPHPTISESIESLGERMEGDPEVSFIHLNHTNPALDRGSKEFGELADMGWSVVEQGSKISL